MPPFSYANSEQVTEDRSASEFEMVCVKRGTPKRFWQ